MRNTKTYVYVILSLVFLSCNENQKEITSIGNAGEIRIFASGNTFRNNNLEALIKVLSKPQAYLAESESYFQIDTVSFPQLDENSFSFSHILIVKLPDEKLEMDGLEFQDDLNDTDVSLSIHRNIYAYPQVIYLLEAGSEKALKKYLKGNINELFVNFLNSERSNDKKNILANTSDTILQFVNKEFGIDLFFPNDYKLTKYIQKNDRQFAWIRKETPQMSLGVIIYKEPYIDSSQLELRKRIEMRDSVTRNNIPGATEKSYMETEVQFPIIQNNVKINEIKAIETRGMWKVKNDLMGGPFYSLTFVNEEEQMLYTVEGFLYAPRNEKTSYLRQLEAIVNSVQLTD